VVARAARAWIPEAVDADLVDESLEDRVAGAQLGDRPGLDSALRPKLGVGAQGCPSTAPGTPVLVEYLGWIFVSGRISCTA
jgi:hypothetical protein